MLRLSQNVYREVALMILLGFCIGCSGSEISSAVVESSQSKFDQAQVLINMKDFAGALPLLEDAIAAGGLDADFSVESLVARARCYLELGKLPEALSEIESLAMGATDMTVVHGLRYQYWMKSGDSGKAQAELLLAQKLNPAFRVQQ